MERKPYSAGAVKFSFWFMEFRKTVQLLSEGKRLDLDDGVKVNYRKLQTAQDGKFYEVLADSKNIMAKQRGKV